VVHNASRMDHAYALASLGPSPATDNHGNLFKMMVSKFFPRLKKPPTPKTKAKNTENNQVEKNKILTVTYFPEGTKRKDQELAWQS